METHVTRRRVYQTGVTYGRQASLGGMSRCLAGPHVMIPHFILVCTAVQYMYAGHGKRPCTFLCRDCCTTDPAPGLPDSDPVLTPLYHRPRPRGSRTQHTYTPLHRRPTLQAPEHTLCSHRYTTDPRPRLPEASSTSQHRAGLHTLTAVRLGPGSHCRFTL